MKLGVFLELGGSIKGLAKTGQDRRFKKYYLRRYLEDFEEVLLLSYGDEEPNMPKGARFLKNKTGFRREIYTFFAPFFRPQVLDSDVVRVMQITGTIPAIITKILCGIPYVTTYGYRYSDFLKIEKGRLFAFLVGIVERLGLFFADRVIVTTPGLENHVSKLVSKEKIVLIPNGVDTEEFAPKKTSKESKKKTIMFVGRFEKQKNLFALIDAVSEIKGARLVFVGGGSLECELRERALNRGVELEMRDFVSHEMLPQTLNEADVFVLPSLIEGHPKILIEAMSCARPCVATDVKGNRDLIEDKKTGLLCKTDADSLKEKIEWLLKNPNEAQKQAAAAREFVKDNYEITRFLNRETELLLSLAKK
jgi:glycosyltransferase involved in cell wall biosynthesis